MYNLCLTLESISVNSVKEKSCPSYIHTQQQFVASLQDCVEGVDVHFSSKSNVLFKFFVVELWSLGHTLELHHAASCALSLTLLEITQKKWVKNMLTSPIVRIRKEPQKLLFVVVVLPTFQFTCLDLDVFSQIVLIIEVKLCCQHHCFMTVINYNDYSDKCYTLALCC